MKEAADINLSDFNKFLPLIGNIRMESRAAMFLFLVIGLRRIFMLFMAMFVRGMPWLQLKVFV